MSKTISVDSWMAELEKATRRTATDEGFRTAYEIGQATGKSYHAIARRLREGVRSGLIEVRKEPRPDILGIMHSQPVYRPVKKKTKADTR